MSSVVSLLQPSGIGKVTAVLSLFIAKSYDSSFTTLFIVDKRIFVKGEKQLNCYKIVRSCNVGIVHNSNNL